MIKYKPEFAEEARKLCEAGAKNDDLAAHFGVHRRTIWTWGSLHPEFGEAVKIAKANADDRVERSLYERATGYSYDAVKIFLPAGSTEPVIVPYTEHVPPDTASMIFWLKNRRPEQWRDRQQTDVTINYVARIPSVSESIDAWSEEVKLIETVPNK